MATRSIALPAAQSLIGSECCVAFPQIIDNDVSQEVRDYLEVWGRCFSVLDSDELFVWVGIADRPNAGRLRIPATVFGELVESYFEK